MERSEIRRKALAAAASVVLSMGLPACGGGEGKDPDGRVGDDGGTSTTDSGTADGSADGTDGSADGTADGGEGADGTSTDSGSSDGGTDGGGDTATEMKPDCAALGLDITACCEALAAWCTAYVGAGSTAYDECVYGPGYDGSTGCIPWGPPVPPSAVA